MKQSADFERNIVAQLQLTETLLQLFVQNVAIYLVIAIWLKWMHSSLIAIKIEEKIGDFFKSFQKSHGKSPLTYYCKSLIGILMKSVVEWQLLDLLSLFLPKSKNVKRKRTVWISISHSSRVRLTEFVARNWGDNTPERRDQITTSRDKVSMTRLQSQSSLFVVCHSAFVFVSKKVKVNRSISRWENHQCKW